MQTTLVSNSKNSSIFSRERAARKLKQRRSYIFSTSPRKDNGQNFKANISGETSTGLNLNKNDERYLC